MPRIEINKQVDITDMELVFTKLKSGGYSFEIKFETQDENCNTKDIIVKGEEAIKLIGGYHPYINSTGTENKNALKIDVCDDFLEAVFDNWTIIDENDLSDLIKKNYGISWV